MELPLARSLRSLLSSRPPRTHTQTRARLTAQDELRATRHSLERASQEVETLRRSKDHLSGGWDEASRLRERLHGAESLCAEMSARAAAAEPLVEEERWGGQRGGRGGGTRR